MEVPPPTANPGAERPALTLPRTEARHDVLERVAREARPTTDPGSAGHTRALNDLERAGLVEVVYRPTEAGRRLLAAWDTLREHEKWAQQTLASFDTPASAAPADEPPADDTGDAYEPPDPDAPEPWACWRWDGTEQGWTQVATGQRDVMEAEIERRVGLLKKMGQSTPHHAGPISQRPDPLVAVVDFPEQPPEPEEPVKPKARRRPATTKA